MKNKSYLRIERLTPEILNSNTPIWVNPVGGLGDIVMLSSEENLPEDTSGFYLSREDKSDRWDYTAFTTIYRVISPKQIQFSDDGSKYIPPTKTVIVQAFFQDGDDIYGFRPNEVDVQMYKNGKKSAIATLLASKDYKKTYADRLVEDVFTIDAPDLLHYDKNVSGTTVTYSVFIPSPRTITTDDLAECILNSNSDHKNNIYASYCENNVKNFYNDVPATAQSKVQAVIDDDGFMVNEDGTVSVKPINGGAEA